MQRSTGLVALCLAISLALAAPAGAVSAPDAWITTRVKMGLLTSEGLGTARAIDVDTVDGRVTLHGAVESADAKAKAEQVARSVGGVRDVRNLLAVQPAPGGAPVKVSDDVLEKQVKTALSRDEALKDSRIEVRSVDDGVVVLAGKAETLSDARRALEDAAGVQGVRRVKSEIAHPEQLGEHETWREGAYDKAAYAGSAARDLWITSDAKMRLLVDTETPGFDVNVDTHDQVVTLFGTVESEQAKRQAEAEVRKVDGVKDVRNDLQVVPPAEAKSVARTDDQLHDAIEKSFDTSPRLADAGIGVEVKNGVARLSGSVPSRSDQVAALTLARSTQGVRRVIDDLRLEPPAVGSR